MKRLLLLGIWNQLPFEAWKWFSDDSVERLYKLTGIRIKVFTYVKNNLNYECFFDESSQQLKSKFDKLSTNGQQLFINKLVNDYYLHAKPLSSYLNKLQQAKFKQRSKQGLITEIKQLNSLWSEVTMQIWYVVLFDIWYPSFNEKISFKKQLAKARDHCGRLHEQSKQIENRIYEEVARRTGISYPKLQYLFPSEIIETLENPSRYKKIITERMKLCVTTNITGKYRIYQGSDADKLMKKYSPPAINKVKPKNLVGMPASPGKVNGRARVILLDDEFNQFKQKEILVSLQTMVHFLPIMKKSKAILTEFGGLTSHAAIVSRELKKPAIVGISGLIASVKTGDLIEVDANKGIVRKIK